MISFKYEARRMRASVGCLLVLLNVVACGSEGRTHSHGSRLAEEGGSNNAGAGGKDKNTSGGDVITGPGGSVNIIVHGKKPSPPPHHPTPHADNHTPPQNPIRPSPSASSSVPPAASDDQPAPLMAREMINTDPNSHNFGKSDGIFAPDPDQPSQGILHFSQGGLISAMEQRYRDNPGAYDADLAARQIQAAKDGKIEGLVPAHINPKTGVLEWSRQDIQGWEKAKGHAPRAALSHDFEPDQAPTLSYQQGPATPMTITANPAVDLSADRGGESLLPGSRNTLSPGGGGTPQVASNTNPHGLPGADSPDGSHAPKTLDESTEEGKALAKRVGAAFGADLQEVGSAVEAAGLALNAATTDAQGQHEHSLSGLGAASGLEDVGQLSSASPQPAPEPVLGSPENPNEVGHYPFQTPRDSQEGRELEDAWFYEKNVSDNIDSNDVRAPQKRQLVRTADASLHKADAAFGSGDRGVAEFALHLGLRALDAVVGGGKDGQDSLIYKALVGYDPLTDQKVSPFMQGAAMVAATIALDAEILAITGVVAEVAAGVAIVGGIIYGVATVAGDVAEAIKDAKDVAEYEANKGARIPIRIEDGTPPAKEGGGIDESKSPNKPFSEKERKIAKMLEREGHKVEKVPEENGKRTPDALVDSEPTEFKTLKPKPGKNTLTGAIKDAIVQGGENIVIDVEATDISRDQALREIPRTMSSPDVKSKNVKSIRIFGKDFDLRVYF